MIQSPRLTFARLATLGALVAALGLAGCGRKSGLDAPPMAVAGDSQAAGQPGTAPTLGPQALGPQALGPDGRPVSRPAEKRQTFLDWLID